MLHKILTRQINKYLGESYVGTEEMKKLLQAVSDTYTHFDEDRLFTDRSLDMSSRELMEINEKLTSYNAELKLKTDESERFNGFMVNRELQMVKLKKQVKALENELALLKRGA